MKKLSIIILLTVLLNTYLAEDSCKVSGSELQHGIQFQVSSLSLRNFNNYSLAYRYLLDGNSGLRIGVLTSISDEDNDGIQRIDSLEVDVPYEYRDYNFKLSIQYLRTILRDNDFSLFIGGGPFLSYNNKLGKSISSSLGYRREYKDLSNSFGYGFDLLLGVEYSLSKNVVLSGEYGLSLLLESGESERKDNIYYYDDRPDRISERSSEISKYTLTGIGVSLGLTIFL